MSEMTLLGAIIGALAPVVIGVGLSVLIIAWMEGWRPRLSLPPYNPPDDPEVWKVLALVRLAPRPRLPCGCRASWSDVTYTRTPEPDGTITETIGEFEGCTRDWGMTRDVEVDNAGVWVTNREGRIHTHESCGRSWPAPGMEWHSTTPSESETERYDHPPDSANMRALPDGWTRMNRGLSEEAGQVSEYVYDETWEAFVDVFDTSHDGNSYDPSEGSVCAVLLIGSPERGLWERDEVYADGRTEAAKPLMRRYNDGEYES